MTKHPETKAYRYRPVLFFTLTYLFTWIFWIPAAFVPEDTGAVLMLAGLIAPAVVSTLFVLLSGSEALKKDLKVKLVGLRKVKWSNVFLAVGVFALIVAGSMGMAGAAALCAEAALRCGAGLVTVACPESVVPIL